MILTREKGYQKPVTGKPQRLSRMLYRNYPELVRQLESRNQRYNETIKYLEKLESEQKVLLIALIRYWSAGQTTIQSGWKLFTVRDMRRQIKNWERSGILFVPAGSKGCGKGE